jgi:hypothetical protein
MVNPYGPHAKCLEERHKAEVSGNPHPSQPPIPPKMMLPTEPMIYQPEMLTIRRDYVDMAIAAIDAGLDHAREALIVHDSNLGRTTKKNLSWARIIEADIRQMEECLRVLRALP